MQRQIPILQQPSALHPLKDATNVTTVDYSTNFGGLYKRIENLDNFFKSGKASSELIRYIPELAKAAFQGPTDEIQTKKAYADDTYKALRIAKFNIQLTFNIQFHNIHLVFPMKIKTKRKRCKRHC